MEQSEHNLRAQNSAAQRLSPIVVNQAMPRALFARLMNEIGVCIQSLSIFNFYAIFWNKRGNYIRPVFEQHCILRWDVSKTSTQYSIYWRKHPYLIILL